MCLKFVCLLAGCEKYFVLANSRDVTKCNDATLLALLIID